MPNTPLTLQLPPPTKKGEATEATMLNTLPDVNATVQGMATLWLLSQKSSDFVSEKNFFGLNFKLQLYLCWHGLQKWKINNVYCTWNLPKNVSSLLFEAPQRNPNSPNLKFHWSHQVPLGHYPEDHFIEDTPRRMIQDFQRQLEVLSGAIKDRNKHLEVPYTYLDPVEVENSVAIWKMYQVCNLYWANVMYYVLLEHMGKFFTTFSPH